jgi:ABC-type uncharacterized transport system YnjBCD substrate-binding protein
LRLKHAARPSTGICGGGNKDILRWVNGYLKTRLANEYGVKLNVVPLENVKKTINQVRDERRKGISSNAKSKAGAMVLANLILDPATQFEKMKPTVWGDQPILDTTKLPKKWRAKFESFPRHPSTLSREELTAHQLPELQSSWVLHI